MIPREEQTDDQLAFMDEAVLMVCPRSPRLHLRDPLTHARRHAGRRSARSEGDSRRLRPRARRQDRRARAKPDKRGAQRDASCRVRRPPPPPARPLAPHDPSAYSSLHAPSRRRADSERRGRETQSVAHSAQRRRPLRDRRALPHVRISHAPGRHREGLLRVRQRPLWRDRRRAVDSFRVRSFSPLRLTAR